jgi:hypothetical protein
MPAGREGRFLGQAAMEYLMTYGWAILIALAVGVVLWQMGIFNTQAATPGKSGFSDITVLDWKASSGGSVDLLLSNNAETRQNLNTVESKLIAGGASGSTCSASFGGEEVLPGATKSVTLSGCGITEAVGEYYKLEITIDYQNPSSSISHSSVGEVWGPIE